MVVPAIGSFIGAWRSVQFEYAQLDPSGHPAGDLVPFGRVVFPFDAGLQAGVAGVTAPIPVERREEGPEIEERYVIDAHGIVTVRITDLRTGFTREESLATT